MSATGILAGTSTATTALSLGASLIGGLTNLLLASPQKTQGYQPQNPPQSTGIISQFSPPPSLMFHYEGEQTTTIQSDITDHFIEDNTSVQDQIAIKPVIVTTHGFIGELNNVPPAALKFLQSAANVLTNVGSYAPAVSTTASIAYNEAFAAYQLAASAVNAGVSAVTGLLGTSGTSVIGAGGQISPASNQNNQQTMFQQFYGYWYNRTLFTVQTPWAIFQNMAILSLRAIQSEETRMITDFEVTFKQINIASTQLLGSQTTPLGRLASQAASLTGNGTGALSPSTSVSQGLTNMGAAP